MRKVIAVGLLLLAACSQNPPGRCDSDLNCGPGTICAGGVCAGCDSATDCREYQTCDVNSHGCQSAPGRCARTAECLPWELCNDTHTCVLNPTGCYDASDCPSHKECTNHVCVVKQGRCDQASDCSGFWPSCDGSNFCTLSAPGGNDVFLWGTLSQGTKVGNVPWDYDCLVPVHDPTNVRVGFTGDPANGVGAAVVEPGGYLAYSDKESVPPRVRSFRPDGWGAGTDLGGYPSDGGANDSFYPATACASTDPVVRFVLRERTGEMLYACGTTGGAWFDAEGNGTLAGMALLAWNYDGAILGYDPVPGASLVVVGTDGVRHSVPALSASALLDARANAAGGFWVAVRRTNSELWRVDNTGVATNVATYAAKPSVAVHGIGPGDRALASNGDLYTIDDVIPLPSVYMQLVVKYPANGAASSIAYDERTAQFNSRSGPPFINPAGSLAAPGFEGLSRLVRGP